MRESSAIIEATTSRVLSPEALSVTAIVRSVAVCAWTLRMARTSSRGRRTVGIITVITSGRLLRAGPFGGRPPDYVADVARRDGVARGEVRHRGYQVGANQDDGARACGEHESKPVRHADHREDASDMCEPAQHRLSQALAADAGKSLRVGVKVIDDPRGSS